MAKDEGEKLWGWLGIALSNNHRIDEYLRGRWKK
jgi:hypothetical protein